MVTTHIFISDLLRRHAARHETADLEAATGAASLRKTRACDACRANKTRCSGAGPQCNLCTKRGVECVYSDDEKPLEGARLPECSQSRGEASSADVPATTATPGSAAQRLRSLAPDLVNFLSACSVQPSSTHTAAYEQPATRPSEPATRPIHAAGHRNSQSGSLVDAILEIILSSSRNSRLGETIAASSKFEAWVTCCIDTYFEFFHPRWPLLHAPTVNASSSPLLLVATIVMVGCWFQGRPEDKPAIWRLFNFMTRISFEKLVGRGCLFDKDP